MTLLILSFLLPITHLRTFFFFFVSSRPLTSPPAHTSPEGRSAAATTNIKTHKYSVQLKTSSGQIFQVGYEAIKRFAPASIRFSFGAPRLGYEAISK